jgi:hypothetical protein
VSEDHNVKIDGKRWLLRFTRLKGDAAGWTFFDNAKRPRILIDEKLKGGERLETILHELAHAVLGPTISEESITIAFMPGLLPLPCGSSGCSLASWPHTSHGPPTSPDIS